MSTITVEAEAATLTKEQAEYVVKEHGHLTKIDPDTGVLMGGILCLWVHTGESSIDWSPVPLNVAALRDWLGY